jgi:hypothetical protein
MKGVETTKSLLDASKAAIARYFGKHKILIEPVWSRVHPAGQKGVVWLGSVS